MASYQLRPLIEDDLRLILKWRNSEQIRSASMNNQLISYEEHFNWYLNVKKCNSTLLIFDIDSVPSGFIKFELVDDKTAEWSIYKDPENSKKYGRIMGGMAIDYAFNSLTINKITAKVISTNSQSLRFHELLGFKMQESLLCQYANSPKNVILLELLSANEWRNKC
jgi:UDP-4-amino-4,6-dideoxy-N-acetyl-beta-L-altrosamine N-acetyltransferase